MKKVWLIGANSDVAKELMLQMDGKYSIVAASRNYCAVKDFIKKKKIRRAVAVELDVCNKDNLESFLFSMQQPDIVIFSQGKLETGSNVGDYLDEMVQCNYVACIRIIEKVWKGMADKGKGCITGITSVAADRGKMSNKLYSSTKAAFSCYLQALMQEGEKTGIQVIDIKPGYIRSKMLISNRKAYKSVLAAEPSEAATSILQKIESGRSGTVYTKKIWRLIMWGLKLMPERIYNKMSL
ncbi:SDR family NAD(P)-dependent oxidoreductase [bacterium D16-51]|nr:SDR family NAD(P)-dependent oxidoreductase [bacterium D16-59]RKI60630.1 SDR family NAD(P)-dependent oxidoreductase [bacterium D16-51]